MFKVEDVVKGRIAETLFEELMRQSGNVVYRFGYEAITQNLVQLREQFDRYTGVGEQLRAIPDFIVLDKKGNPIFVEVKFRWNGELHRNDYSMLERIRRFWASRVVVVNCWEQPYFRFSDPPYLDTKNKNLVSRPLFEEKNWNVDKILYEECEELIHRYLTPTLIPARKSGHT